jgi:hypothetical protein
MSGPAHLRRNRALLEWICVQQPDAEVHWKGRFLGSWEKIEARWRIAGERIRFSFRLQDRQKVAWISSIQSRSGGLRILLKQHHRDAVPDELEIHWGDGVRDQATGPSDLWPHLRQWIRSEMPGCLVLSVERRSDRARTLSGRFLRIHVRYRGNDCLIMAAGAGADADAELEGSMLTQGLLWLDWLRRRKRLPEPATLFLLVSEGRATVLYHRSRFLNAERVRPVIWEYGDPSDQPWQPHPASAPPAPEEHRDFKWPLLGPFRWSEPLARVLDLAPQWIRRHPRFQEYDSLRILGLEFARVLGVHRDRICFGIGAQETELSEETFENLRALVNQILFFRRPDSPDSRHPCYRLQSERWLECLILDDVPRLFPELVPEAVYSQIPVYLGKEAGRVDILGADREGTLVVMELKVAENPDLPLQCLDYWGRVTDHNLRGDFERRGYFAGTRLNRRKAKIYLVSPVFSFHDSTERVLRYLESDLEVWKIAINEDWRNGVRVLAHRRVKCGELP